MKFQALFTVKAIRRFAVKGTFECSVKLTQAGVGEVSPVRSASQLVSSIALSNRAPFYALITVQMASPRSICALL